MAVGISKTVAGNQISAPESPHKPRKDKRHPRFPIDRRTVIGARVAAFERDLVARTLARNGKTKGKPRPLTPDQRKRIRLACAYEALCARLEHALLVGDSLDTRGLIEATDKRDGLVRWLT